MYILRFTTQKYVPSSKHTKSTKKRKSPVWISKFSLCNYGLSIANCQSFFRSIGAIFRASGLVALVHQRHNQGIRRGARARQDLYDQRPSVARQLQWGQCSNVNILRQNHGWTGGRPVRSWVKFTEAHKYFCIYILYTYVFPINTMYLSSVFLSIHPSICLSVCRSTHPPIHPSIYQSIRITILYNSM